MSCLTWHLRTETKIACLTFWCNRVLKEATALFLREGNSSCRFFYQIVICKGAVRGLNQVKNYMNKAASEPCGARPKMAQEHEE